MTDESAAILRRHCVERHHLPDYKPGEEIVVDGRLGSWHRHEHATGVFEPHAPLDLDGRDDKRPGPVTARWPESMARPHGMRGI